MFSNKKALGLGRVFIFIVAAITFALIMIFGYKAVTDFLQKGEQVQFYQFKTDLENSVQRIYTEYGSVRVEQFQIPRRYEQICLVDLDAPFNSALCQYDQVACAVWKQSLGYSTIDENVFLKPTAPVKIKTAKISLKQDFFCVPIIDGTFSLTMEGRGTAAELYSDLSEEGETIKTTPEVPFTTEIIPPTPTFKEPTECHPERLNFLGYGQLRWQDAGNDLTVVAPHGGYDRNTEDIVREMVKEYPMNYVLAIGFRNPDGINVNRPTEAKSDEISSERATKVYEVFRDCVDQYPQRIYLEVHGYTEDSDTRGIQIATVNVDNHLAAFIENTLTQNLPSGTADQEILIEPLDRIHWTAGWNKRIGMLSHCDNICIHIELPRKFREDTEVEETAVILAALMEELDHYTLKP